MVAPSPTERTETRPTDVLARYRLFDTHCHLSQMSNAEKIARDAAEAGLAIFDCGVEPGAFERQRERFADVDNVRAGVGLHPWWLSDGRSAERDIELLCKIAQHERFIGEVGLDFSRKHEASREMQTRAFDMLCAALAAHPACGRVLSVHAVQSAGTVLDILEAHGLISEKAARNTPGKAGTAADNADGAPGKTEPYAGNGPGPNRAPAKTALDSGGTGAHGNTDTVIFHWFSGSGDELVRARKAGCYFSVNEMMLATRRGRAYAKQIPEDRLLLETDAPPELGAPYTAEALLGQLDRTLDALAEIRDVPKCKLAQTIATTSALLLGAD